MKITLTTLTLFFAISSHATTQQKYDWTCHDADGNEVMSLTYDGKDVTEEKINGYKVIEAGEQVPDREIGPSVFNVEVSPLEILENTTLKLQLSLQDYSDHQSWTVFLQGTKTDYSAEITSTFQSSDGDGLVHVETKHLQCDVKEEI